jgi:hypothetical protein
METQISQKDKDRIETAPGEQKNVKIKKTPAIMIYRRDS